MSIQSVATAAGDAHAAMEIAKGKESDLKKEMSAAAQAGVPIAVIARAAGVSRPTAMKWIDQAH